MVTLRPSAFIALEGLDATGKSTQLRNLATVCPGALVSHQPSGAPGVGADIYRLTEEVDLQSRLARQLLHLACHAEQYAAQILPALAAGQPVVLDRCWWSTVAYG